MPPKSLKTLFFTELGDIFSIETQVSEGLSQLHAGTSTEELTEAIGVDLKRIRKSAETLKSKLEGLDGKRKMRPEAATKAMLVDCSSCLKRYPAGNLRDAALLAVLRRLAEYRVAVYVSTLALAEQMGEQAMAEFLREAATAEQVGAKKFAQIPGERRSLYRHSRGTVCSQRLLIPHGLKPGNRPIYIFDLNATRCRFAGQLPAHLCC